MKYNLLVFSLLLNLIALSQINQEEEDLKHNQIILVGELDKSGFMLDNYRKWFEQEYSDYNLDSVAIQKISKFDFTNIKILIFMATWCSDSREQVPRFYKILESINPKIVRQVYGLDSNKSCANINTSVYKIERVPTFVFYLDNKEIGRIVESPKISLEMDVLEILKTGNK